MRPDTVTLITPTIPPRARMLAETLGTVARQERLPDRHIIEWDHARLGPGPTRNRAIAQVDTEWIALLDDDDELFPPHLRRLMEYAAETGADFVYPRWTVQGITGDPLDMAAHPHFSAKRLRAGNYIPIAVLMRTEAVKDVGGFPTGSDVPMSGTCPLEDYGLWLRLLDAGARFEHLGEITWRYNFWSGQLHGQKWVPM